MTKRFRRLRRVLVALAMLAVPTGWSYGHALTYPGSASWSVRSVDWFRAHGGAPIVDSAEVWYYSHQEPPSHGVPAHPPSAPTAPQARFVDALADAGAVPALDPAVPPRLPGEAAWTPGPTGRTGRPATYTSWFRPDPRHPTMIAGVLWMDRHQTGLHLQAGTAEPGGSGWPGRGRVPSTGPATTVAAFNSGFLMADNGGGAFYENGHQRGHLAAGLASLVFDRQGHVQVGDWNRQVAMAPDTYAVRQNLHLVVDRHRPVAGLVHNASKRWGSRKSQLQYTWRSGIGVDDRGNAIYVAGDHFTLVTLAQALVQAGAVRAMQLDIHPQMVTANLYRLGPGDPRSGPQKLLPGMVRPATRYLAPDQRDFVSVTLR